MSIQYFALKINLMDPSSQSLSKKGKYWKAKEGESHGMFRCAVEDEEKEVVGGESGASSSRVSCRHAL